MNLGNRHFCISLQWWHNLFKVRRSTLEQFILVPKEKVCVCLAFLGLLIAMLGSLNPWFMWPVNSKFPLLSSVFFLPALFIAMGRKNDTVFTRKDLLVAFFVFVIYEFYILVVNDRNVFGYVVGIFHILIVYVLFKLDQRYYDSLMTIACKGMALLMCVSIPCFILHLAGVSFPRYQTVFGENQYSFTSYYFFLVDNRSLYEIIPRFHSVFLEPGHLGTATIMLLLTQMGKWRKWYNVVLWFTTFMTFSLAAYVFGVALMILNLWVQRRKILVKLLVVVSLIASIGIGAVYYKDGNNMLHNLIMLRLEVDERTGEMAGNNRVTESFEKEFDSFMTSSDIWLGREMPKNDSGNSGYRVYIYENGICALVLVIMLYIIMYRGAKDRRAVMAVWCIAFLAFVVRGYPLWYSNFIPCMIAGYSTFNTKRERS